MAPIRLTVTINEICTQTHLLRGCRQYIATGLHPQHTTHVAALHPQHTTHVAARKLYYSYRHNQHSWYGTASNYQ